MVSEEDWQKAAEKLQQEVTNASIAREVEREVAAWREEAARLAEENGTSLEDELTQIVRAQIAREKDDRN